MLVQLFAIDHGNGTGGLAMGTSTFMAVPVTTMVSPALGNSLSACSAANTGRDASRQESGSSCAPLFRITAFGVFLRNHIKCLKYQ